MKSDKSNTVGWAQVVATVFLGVVGLIFTFVQDKQQEKNRIALTSAQMLSQREQSEMNFRQQMFGVLVREILDPELDVGERVTRLELFQHNFHDVFNGRALFDELEKEAEKLPPETGGEVIEDLVSLAQEITEAQELQVGAFPEPIQITEGDTVVERVRPPDLHEHTGEEKHEHNENDSHAIIIRLVDVREHSVDVEAWFDTEAADIGESEGITFEVSYYDAPMTDNTLLPDHHRFAITLKETNIDVHPHTASLNVFEFPAHYVTTGYRPSIREFDEMVSEVD